jgi:flagellar motor switch protein FliM
MSEADKILSQHEVDALLSAIDSGEVEVTPEAAAAPQAMPYDFKRPERVARDQLRSIETLHDVYARNLQGALSGMLRTVVDVKIASVDQLTFLEFINSLPNPTVFTVLSCEPLEGNFILEVNPIIAFPIIERLLGSGKVGASQPERALTRIEWEIIDRVIARALELMKEVWASIAPVNFRVTAREANPQLMQIFSANEAVVSVVAEVSMGDHKGYMNICLPVMTIEGHMEKISSHSWFSSRKKDRAPSQESTISRQLAPAELVVTTHLPVETLRMKDLETLRVGDCLVTNQPVKAPVLISVEGRPKYIARIGKVNNDRYKGFMVLSMVDPAREPIITQARTALSVQKAAPAGKGKSKKTDEPASAAPDPAVVENILRVPLVSTVVLAEKTLRVKDILGLKVGDIIEFAKSVDEALPLRSGGRGVAEGTAVKIGEKFGLQVTAVRDPRETVTALGP